MAALIIGSGVLALAVTFIAAARRSWRERDAWSDEEWAAWQRAEEEHELITLIVLLDDDD